MNKAFLGTMINASGPEKNRTWLHHCSKELLLTLKIKYDLFLRYLCILCVGAEDFWSWVRLSRLLTLLFFNRFILHRLLLSLS